MGLFERKSLVDDAGGDIDLKPFINFLIVIIPVLMLSSEFAKVSVLNLQLPVDMGSTTAQAQQNRPIVDQNKLQLTMLITDSVVTIGAKNGLLPPLYYKEFHQYVSAADRRVRTTIAYDPHSPGKTAMNPKTGKPFKISERQDIFLYVTDENAKIQNCLYTRDGFMIADEDGKPVTAVKVGDVVYEVTNPRKQITIQNPEIYRLSPLSAYDEMKNRLMKIKERFSDATDADDITIAAENSVAYDKIVQLMDIARIAEFPNISIAKLRG
jgi:biopolymer transport protein ExbD